MAFSPDGRVVASVNDSGALRLYDPSTRKTTTVSVGEGLGDVVFSPDGSALAGSASTGNDVWCIACGQDKRPCSTKWLGSFSVAFSPDGRTLASGDHNGQIVLHDLAHGQQQVLTNADGQTSTPWPSAQTEGPLPAPMAAARSISSISQQVDTPSSKMGVPPTHLPSARTRKTLATGDASGHVNVYSLASGHVTTFNNGTQVLAVALALTGRSLATGNATGQVLIYGLAGALSRSVQVRSAIEQVAFSPDGGTLAVADDGDEVVLYRPATGEQDVINTPHNVNGISLAQRGRQLVLADNNGRVVLFDLATHHERVLRKEDGNQMYSAAFSPNGKYVW